MPNFIEIMTGVFKLPGRLQLFAQTDFCSISRNLCQQNLTEILPSSWCFIILLSSYNKHSHIELSDSHYNIKDRKQALYRQ